MLRYYRRTLTQVLFYSTVTAFLGTLSCIRSQPRPESNVKIDKGTYFSFWSQNKASPVIELLGCTATIVSTNTVITAAHCVGAVTDSRFAGSNIYYSACIDTKEYRSACTKDIHVPSQFIIRKQNGDDTGERDFRYDLAVLVFEKNPFKYFFKLGDVSLEKDMNVVMVGYSAKEMTEKKSNPKRWGSNIISKIDAKENTIESLITSGVAISPGDSGGPLLHKCKLVGVASRMQLVKGVKTSIHTHILAPVLHDFLLDTTTKGAKICGLGANDESFCPPTQEYKEVEAPKEDEFSCNSQKKPWLFK